MNKVYDKIPALVAEELEAANNIHSFFHSAHEGYAVIQEEVEEVHEEKKAVETFLALMWNHIRLDNDTATAQFAARIETAAQRLAAEAIQVAAMARKLQLSLLALSQAGAAE